EDGFEGNPTPIQYTVEDVNGNETGATVTITYVPVTPTPDPSEDPTSDPSQDPTSDPSQDPTSDPSQDPTKDPKPNPGDPGDPNDDGKPLPRTGVTGFTAFALVSGLVLLSAGGVIMWAARRHDAP
ncbi:LPXTG cell wall anchor domain-containing protein, partial [Brevibacterium salitolerans]